jgi:hypothetical protein
MKKYYRHLSKPAFGKLFFRTAFYIQMLLHLKIVHPRMKEPKQTFKFNGKVVDID